ncbi:PaaI family thioesterase [Glycomyces sp. NPDC048151]|uniref:PaaI family thioesterase n=1 Tax=Glycomyces sp. NPDC048151 TaxID=3364002 RepID=UPI003722EC50
MADDDLQRRRDLIDDLGGELRALIETAVRTDMSAETLQELVGEVKRLEDRFTGMRRKRSHIPDVDVFPGGLRVYSPASGPGNPFAPPLRIEPDAEGVSGRCTLGVVHEGPPGFAHGGVSAMLLDEMMGWACYAAGMPAMTISLDVRYRGPVPIETPLELRSRITATADRKLSVEARISAEADPEAVLVSGTGVFVAPDLDQARALFPGAKGFAAGNRPPTAA